MESPLYCTDRKELGYHLRADIMHDFKAPTAGTLKYAPVMDRAKEYNEDVVTNYFLTKPGASVITDFDLRSPNQQVFVLPEKTTAFQSWTAPSLYTTGNNVVGIIQDAGHYITDAMGAQNVLTFGSVLDPAPKPAGPDRDPVWFDPSENKVRIPLDMFGFVPGVIDALEVSDFAGGIAVKASYVVGDTITDAIALGAKTKPGVKPISKVDVGVAGFFTSIAKAENIPTELTISKVFSTDALARDFLKDNSEKFYIGKTLGDVMLVASAMKDFCGVANPYTGILTAGTWRDISNNELTRPPPETLILKTGDRLNWVRAIIMGVGAIYEDQAKGARKAIQYKFFPAQLSDAALRVSLINGFGAITSDITSRYDGVIQSLDTILDRIGAGMDQVSVNDTAIFFGEDVPVLKSPTGRKLGGDVVQRIKADLAFLKERVIGWIETRKAGTSALANDALRKLYEDTRVRANACAPAAPSIFVLKSNAMRIPMKIIVANVPPSALAADWPLSVSIDIAMRMAFGKLNTASNEENGLAGTDLQKRFFAKLDILRVPAGAQSGGANPDPLDVKETIDPIINASKDLTATQPAVLVLNDVEDSLLEDYPYIRGLRVYLDEVHHAHVGRVWNVAYNIAKHKGNPACIDDILASAVADECQSLIDRKVLNVSAEADESIDTILFNAYVCCINARNSSGFGKDIIPDTQSEQDFRQLEDAFAGLYESKLNVPALPLQTPTSMTTAPTDGSAPVDTDTTMGVAPADSMTIDQIASLPTDERRALATGEGPKANTASPAVRPAPRAASPPKRKFKRRFSLISSDSELAMDEDGLSTTPPPMRARTGDASSSAPPPVTEVVMSSAGRRPLYKPRVPNQTRRVPRKKGRKTRRQ